MNSPAPRSTPSVDETVAAAVGILGIDEKIARTAVLDARRHRVDPSPEQVARVGAIIRRGLDRSKRVLGK